MATLVAPLGNMVMSSPLVVDETLRIEPTPPHMRAWIGTAFEQRLMRHPARYDHCIVVTDFNAPDHMESRAILENLVTLLRIFKAGNVFHSGGIIDKEGWYADPGTEKRIEQFGVFFFMGWGHPGSEPTYSVDKHEQQALAEFVRAHRHKRKLLQTRPFHSFFKGYHEPYTQDKFLDNAIALENLLVNDGGRSESTYKFTDRGCFLLKTADRTGDVGVFAAQLKKIYDARSGLVHGRKGPSEGSEELADLVRISDQYLRLLLRFVLENEEYKDSAFLDSRKRAAY